MKALTLTQPWATLVAIGAKKIETRGWSTSYRGPLAIHAAKRIPPEFKKLCGAVPPEPFASALKGITWRMVETSEWTMHQGLSHNLHLGCVVAICELVHVRQIDSLFNFPTCDGIWYHQRHWRLDEQERAFGDYTVGRYVWLLDNIQPLANPVSAKGALGLWDWNCRTSDLRAALEAQP